MQVPLIYFSLFFYRIYLLRLTYTIGIINSYYWLVTNTYYCYYYFCATLEYYLMKPIPIRTDFFHGMSLFSKFATVCLLTRFRVMVQFKHKPSKITISFSNWNTHPTNGSKFNLAILAVNHKPISVKHLSFNLI